MEQNVQPSGQSNKRHCQMHEVAWSEEFFNQFRDNSVPPPEMEFPPQQDFDTPEMRGSIQHILSTAIGNYALIEFLIGTEQMMRKQGILYQVGTSFVTLYDDTVRNFIVCDLFSIKFVYFYFPGDRPRRYFNTLPQAPNNPNGR